MVPTYTRPPLFSYTQNSYTRDDNQIRCMVEFVFTLKEFADKIREKECCYFVWRKWKKSLISCDVCTGYYDDELVRRNDRSASYSNISIFIIFCCAEWRSSARLRFQ